jgi:hypothetical protein
LTSLLLLLRSISPGIYLLAFAVIIFGISRFILAQREFSWAQFPLERENASQLGGRGITYVIIAIEVIALVWVLSNITYDEFSRLNVAGPVADEPDRFATSVPFEGASDFATPLPGGFDDGPVIQRTQPPSPTPAGTLRPADPRTGCIRNQANIDRPDNGQVIFQTEPIIGTATLDNFGFYRFEIRNLEAGTQFSVIGGAQSDINEPVEDGPLGQVIPQNFPPGEYRFRLVVFDNTNNPRATCEITIFLSDPIPTPTPIGGGIPQNIPPPASSQVSPP